MAERTRHPQPPISEPRWPASSIRPDAPPFIAAPDRATPTFGSWQNGPAYENDWLTYPTGFGSQGSCEFGLSSQQIHVPYQFHASCDLSAAYPVYPNQYNDNTYNIDFQQLLNSPQYPSPYDLKSELVHNSWQSLVGIDTTPEQIYKNYQTRQSRKIRKRGPMDRCDSGYSSMHTTPRNNIREAASVENESLSTCGSAPGADSSTASLPPKGRCNGSGVPLNKCVAEKPFTMSSNSSSNDSSSVGEKQGTLTYSLDDHREREQRLDQFPIKGDCTSPSSSDTEISQSDTATESTTSSSQSIPDLVRLRAKHDLLVSLMKDVYVLLDWTCEKQMRQCTSSSQERADKNNPSNHEIARHNSSLGSKKRKGRDETPPRGEEDGQKKRKVSSSRSDKSHVMLFACPFHKYDNNRYQPSTESGNRYRSCTGPGFKTISHVKQHLKRVHLLIQCVRCWSIFKSAEHFTNHVNDEVRCEKRVQQPEGLDESKMSQIYSRYGSNWESIYEIIFPGAPIPSPYWEPCPPPNHSSLPATPRLDDQLGDFEAYSRRYLPQLIEAHLSSCISVDMAPVEERLKALVADTVRKCQAQLLENYQLRNNASSGSPESGYISRSQSTRSSMNQAFYIEPPPVDPTSLSSLAHVPANEPPVVRDRRSDSAYGSGAGSSSYQSPQHAGRASIMEQTLPDFAATPPTSWDVNSSCSFNPPPYPELFNKPFSANDLDYLDMTDFDMNNPLEFGA